MKSPEVEFRFHQRIVWCTAVLVITGAIALYTATSDTRWDFVFFKQAPLYLLAILIFGVGHQLKPAYLLRMTPAIFWISLVMMGILALPSSGREINRSINLVLFQLQIWEVYKLALVLFIARLLASIHQGHEGIQKGATQLFALTAASIFLLAIQPDLDAIGFVVVSVSLIVIYSQVFPMRMAFGLMSVMAAVSIVVLVGSFLMVRPNKGEQAFHHDAQTKQHIEYAVLRGGLIGVGWAGSREKYSIPAVHTDMIAGHVVESVGSTGFVLVLLLYLIFIVTGLEVAGRYPHYWGRLVALGIVLIFANQVLVNLLIAFQMSPIVAGIPLPFMSGGGSAFLMNTLESGILARLALEVDRTG